MNYKSLNVFQLSKRINRFHQGAVVELAERIERLEPEARRSTLPKKQQRKLGLLPPVNEHQTTPGNVPPPDTAA